MTRKTPSQLRVERAELVRRHAAEKAKPAPVRTAKHSHRTPATRSGWLLAELRTRIRAIDRKLADVSRDE